MRIEIEIPKEFEYDYKSDKFKDFFSRVLCDIEKGKCLCGNYEIETIKMLEKSFDESKPAYDVEKVVEQIYDKLFVHDIPKDIVTEIVRKGGVE